MLETNLESTNLGDWEAGGYSQRPTADQGQLRVDTATCLTQLILTRWPRSTLSPVILGWTCNLNTAHRHGKPSGYITSHLGGLSLLPSVGW